MFTNSLSKDKQFTKNDHPVNELKSQTFLGTTRQSDLKWKHHIRYANGRGAKSIILTQVVRDNVVTIEFTLHRVCSAHSHRLFIYKS